MQRQRIPSPRPNHNRCKLCKELCGGPWPYCSEDCEFLAGVEDSWCREAVQKEIEENQKNPLT